MSSVFKTTSEEAQSSSGDKSSSHEVTRNDKNDSKKWVDGIFKSL